jgi:hypothetical protein
VAGEINLGKGSKRKVRLVRWSRSEKISMVALLLAGVIETVFIALWLMRHTSISKSVCPSHAAQVVRRNAGSPKE